MINVNIVELRTYLYHIKNDVDDYISSALKELNALEKRIKRTVK